MSKRGTIAVLILVTCLLTSSYVHSDSDDLASVACENIDDWLTSGLPLNLIELACTVVDEGQPVGIEYSSDSDQKYASAVQQNDLPENFKQQLLLLLAVWSQE